jgi:hypothetical protein
MEAAGKTRSGQGLLCVPVPIIVFDIGDDVNVANFAVRV